MRVTLHEPGHTGHRLPYVSHLVRALGTLGADVTLATSAATPRSAGFELHLGGLRDRFALDDVGIPADEQSPRARLGALRAALERTRPDHCLLLYADGISQLAGLRSALGLGALRGFGRRSAAHVHALHFRGRYGYPLPGGRAGVRERAKRALSLRTTLAAPWVHLHHLDPHQLATMRDADPALRARSSVMPDPVEVPPPVTREGARRACGLAPDARVLCCVGVLDGRKGIPVTLAAFRRLRARGEADVLYLAGPVEPALRAAIDAGQADLLAAGALVVDDRSLSAHDMYVALIAADAVVAAYAANHTGSSSIVVRACAAGRPVVCTAVDWFERTVPRFELGLTCDPTDEAAFDAALVGALARALAGSGASDAARFLRRFHTADNFAATWLAPVCALQGDEAAAPAPLAWDAAPPASV